jgi:hypothetical protein
MPDDDIIPDAVFPDAKARSVSSAAPKRTLHVICRDRSSSPTSRRVENTIQSVCICIAHPKARKQLQNCRIWLGGVISPMQLPWGLDQRRHGHFPKQDRDTSSSEETHTPTTLRCSNSPSSTERRCASVESFLVNRVDHCHIVSPSGISTRPTQQDSLADSYTTATAAGYYELEFH